ncbi:hypothetical protein FH972_021379 [Carpinus fangiana]|uniref:Uncharacterized protein n=1 Tax=Carpinus fangiana TaxID=176857 RepID=A0A5N6KPS7_9ROSI|nr:hypothetical protein FH972_021379 [Carpinus fangiana]
MSNPAGLPKFCVREPPLEAEAKDICELDDTGRAICEGEATHASKGEVGFDCTANDVRNRGSSDKRLVVAILQHSLRACVPFKHRSCGLVEANGYGPCHGVKSNDAGILASVGKRQMAYQAGIPLLKLPGNAPVFGPKVIFWRRGPSMPDMSSKLWGGNAFMSPGWANIPKLWSLEGKILKSIDGSESEGGELEGDFCWSTSLASALAGRNGQTEHSSPISASANATGTYIGGL